MNFFYGKPMNTLTPCELVLLSLDIDLMNGRKYGTIPPEFYSKMMSMRLKMVLDCDNRGDYSITRFQREFFGTEELDESFVECEVLPDIPMCLN